MTDIQQPQLNWEASATATHPQVSSSLPSEVETCLKNARFVWSYAIALGHDSADISKASSRNVR